ncbi:cysteine desulfurase family protein [Herbiconiux flava]|uniref:Cysteine desulfurase n=1 Tax=Herbiconiux flava TaxID=881268 RepID=A0A852SPJ3_9MICO|nr:cysteine desulfurase family protein [Herbiconiux flava]NYD70727.1 cysteine desulfurase [Herbiconiux flava]GLK17486.1 cysteine desulfurase [Herbiconiux flava]
MPVYLDHAATTPMLPTARAAYVDALGVVGNPSSIHSQGQQAKRMLEEAREAIAVSLGAEPVEVILTSGGTESINLGVKGLFWKRAPRRVVLVPGGEHHATVDAVEWLASHEGAEVVTMPVDALGRLQPSVLSSALQRYGDDVALVSLLWANNEVGTINDVAALVAVARASGVPVHVDAVAAYGYLPIAFDAVGAAALSVSAHKIGGPVGVGALVLARAWEVEPLIHGGSQQRVRSGTQDVAGALAFAAAATSAAADLTHLASSGGDLTQRAASGRESPLVAASGFVAELAALRDRLVAGIRSAVPEAVLRGDPSPAGRLPGNAHLTFPGCDGDSLLFLLDLAGFSVSTGSACQAGVPEISHVLLAMGIPSDEARGALRFTLGHGTTAEEVDALVAALPAAYASARRAGHSTRTPAPTAFA